jgi:threonine dehydratase
MSSLISLSEISQAARAVSGHVLNTPSILSPGMGATLGVPTVLKLELLQRTGSFKARGAAAKLLSLSAAASEVGVVTVSGGNHGIAVAEMASSFGIPATVVMPASAPESAIRRARGAGARVEVTPSMAAAFALVAEIRASGLTLIHPFDDPVVTAGAGTVGLELAEDCWATTNISDVLVSVGGGALISGVAVAIRALHPEVRVWGVETRGAEAMSRAFAVGSPTPVELTSIVSPLSAPSVSQHTYDHARALVHDIVVVSDAEAVKGTLELADHGRVWAEPAAGCLVPAARLVLDRVGVSAFALVICGGNATTTEIREMASALDLI